MEQYIILFLYTAICVLGVFLTDLCLQRWKPHAGRKRVFWLIPVILCSLLSMTGALLPPCPARNILQAVGNIWLGYYLYYGGTLLVLMIIAEILRRVRPGKPGRYGRIFCLSLAVSLILCSYGLYHAQRTKVVSWYIPVQKQTENLDHMRVILIGDLHLGVNSSLATTERMVELINEAQPDVVVVAGDIFTSSYSGLSHPGRYAQALRGIRSKYGVYAVYGNHDVEEPLLGGFALSPVSEAFRSAEIESFIADCGFTALQDQTVLLPGNIQLAGRIDGEKAGDGTSNRLPPEELLAGIDPDLPVLVLEHEPVEFQSLAEAGADLILCGHTHAGQIFPGNLIVPFFNENAWGYARLHGVDTVVTAGVGYYGPPMRIGTDSEITIIDLEFQ